MPRLPLIFLFFLSVVCEGLSAANAVPPTKSSSVSGVVNDPDGKAVPGAKVTFLCFAGVDLSNYPPAEAVFEATTNELGRFDFQNLPDGGPYYIRVEAAGFQLVPRPDYLHALPKPGSKINVSLELGCCGNVDLINPSSLCNLVSGKFEAGGPDAPMGVLYAYQSVIYQAACVDTVFDTPEQISEKVRKLWVLFDQKVRCTQSDGANDPILKYAIAKFNGDFIDDAVKWNVDITKVYDGETIVQFAKRKHDQARNIDHKKLYKEYYEKLRAMEEKQLKALGNKKAN